MVSGVVGRRIEQPELMKPATEPVDRALGMVGQQPPDCVLIGDSVTDIEVSRRAGVRSIGYAKTPERGIELAAAGADAIVSEMAALAFGLAD